MVARIEAAAEKREEARRVSTMTNMERTLLSELDSLARAKVDSDAGRVVIFSGMAHRLKLLVLTAESLRQESLEIVELNSIRFVEPEESAAER